MSGYSNNDFSDVLGQDAGQQDGSGLRKMLEDALAMNKKLVERIEKQDRDKAVDSLFKEKGLDPKVAELMGDNDPAEWIAKYGDLFAGGGNKLDEPADTDQTSDLAKQAAEAEDIDLKNEREAFEAMTGHAPSGEPSKGAQETIDKLKSFTTEADLLKFMGLPGGI